MDITDISLNAEQADKIKQQLEQAINAIDLEFCNSENEKTIKASTLSPHKVIIVIIIIIAALWPKETE